MISIIDDRKFEEDELDILQNIENCQVVEKNNNNIFKNAIEFLS